MFIDLIIVTCIVQCAAQNGLQITLNTCNINKKTQLRLNKIVKCNTFNIYTKDQNVYTYLWCIIRVV